MRFGNIRYCDSYERQDKKLFAEIDLILKVKEPFLEEYDLFHEGQILFTYLHLTANKTLAEALLTSRIRGQSFLTTLGHLSPQQAEGYSGIFL